MRYLHDEDLELQIKLAELPPDGSDLLAAFFSYLALIGAFMMHFNKHTLQSQRVRL